MGGVAKGVARIKFKRRQPPSLLFPSSLSFLFPFFTYPLLPLLSPFTS